MNRATRTFVQTLLTMTIKLTLSMDERIVEKAKLYAKNTGQSLSKIIEKYLETLASEYVQKPEERSTKLRKIIGVAKVPKNFSEEKAKRAYLQNKHL